MEQNNNNQLQVELTQEVGEGIYTNIALISHSPSEFVFDHIRLMPNLPKANVVARLIMTPQNAKRFLRAMQENITRYEQQFGTIKDTEQMPHIPPISFGPR